MIYQSYMEFEKQNWPAGIPFEAKCYDQATGETCGKCDTCKTEKKLFKRYQRMTNGSREKGV